MDVAFQHLDQWWFVGMDLAATRTWFPYVVGATGAADITNAYLYLGIKAGLGAIVLFVLLLVRAYRQLGAALVRARLGDRVRGGSSKAEYLLWGLGCALLVHIVTWFGITYFDQFEAIWLLQFAAIAAVTREYIEREKVQPGRPNHTPARRARSGLPPLLRTLR
jgi:hypothetical protein